MNGCWRSDKEVADGICDCSDFSPVKGCLSELDTVSKDTGFAICPRNPKAILRKEWDKKYRTKEHDKRGKVGARKD